MHPIANESTPETRNLKAKSQQYRLEVKFKDMCRRGPLLVGSSKGFNKASSFLFLGCACCNASLHLALPYLIKESTIPADRIQAIDRHLCNFLYGAETRPLIMCTAERAQPGCKHGDGAK